MTKEFLVIYEEEDDGSPDDSFVVDIARPHREHLGEVDIEHDVEVGLSNTSSAVGKTGFVVSLLGGLSALAVMIAFALGFPDQWYNADNTTRSGGFVTWVMVAGLVSVVLMVAGIVLTHYGRRIKASGRLNGIRVTQKA